MVWVIQRLSRPSQAESTTLRPTPFTGAADQSPLLRPPEALKNVVDELAAEVGETARLMRSESIFCSLLYLRQSARRKSIALKLNLIGAPLCQSIARRAFRDRQSAFLPGILQQRP